MVSVGLIGPVSFIESYLPSLVDMRDFGLSGIYLLNEKPEVSWSKQHRIIAFKTPEALFNLSDLVLVCGNPEIAFPMAGQALRALKQVLVQEPENMDACRQKELLKLAEESGSRIIFGEGYTAHPIVSLLGDRMHNPLRIEMNRSLFCQKEDLGTCLSALLRKDIEFLLRITHREIQKATARPLIYSGEEGVASCQLELDTGCVLSLNYFLHPGGASHRLTIHQSSSVLTVDFPENLLQIQPAGADARPEQILPPKETPEDSRTKEIHSLLLSLSGKNPCHFERNIKALLLSEGLVRKLRIPLPVHPLPHRR